MTIHNAKQTLLQCFILRTLILQSLAVIASSTFSSTSPNGYDTSGSHLFHTSSLMGDNLTARFLQRLAISLTRWDAIYFTKITERGHLWEQEWAFSKGSAYVANVLEAGITRLGFTTFDTITTVLVLSGISIVTHGISIFVFHDLVLKVLGRNAKDDKYKTIAFVAALLHVLSPAGIFLIAPYTEALFSLLSFVGYWLYATGVLYRKDGKILLSAGCFGISCFVRSNGILNGLLFVSRLFEGVLATIQGQQRPRGTFHYIVVLLGGSWMAVCMLWLQYIGWVDYCTGDQPRPWCSRTIPSIYAFVQEHYWNVGFLRYWTVSNLPLFLLATPVLTTLVYTSYTVLTPKASASTNDKQEQRPAWNVDEIASEEANHILKELAVPQLVLAGLALTNYHVQVITRLSSGCLLWYIVLGARVLEDGAQATTTRDISGRKWGHGMVRWFVGYAIVQAVLFGAFLPPA